MIIVINTRVIVSAIDVTGKLIWVGL